MEEDGQGRRDDGEGRFLWSLASLFELPDCTYHESTDWGGLSAAAVCEGEAAHPVANEMSELLSAGRSHFSTDVLGSVCPCDSLSMTSAAAAAAAMGEGEGEGGTSDTLAGLVHLFPVDARWFAIHDRSGAEDEDVAVGMGLLVTRAPLLPLPWSLSPPAAGAAEPTTFYDFAIVCADLYCLTFVAVEADLGFVDVRASLLQLCLAKVQSRWGEGRLGVARVCAEVWTKSENASSLRQRHLSGPSDGHASDDGVRHLASRLGCARVRLSTRGPPPFPVYKAALNDAFSRAEALARFCLRRGGAEERFGATAGRLLPWVVALQRGRLRQQREETSLLEPLLPSATPVPSKDAPLLGAVVFPGTLRDGCTGGRGKLTALPEVVLAFLNAKGSPTFRFDEEALRVVWQVVPALRAAVAVYDDGQRVELIRRLCEWKRKSAAALSETETETLRVTLPSRLYSVERALGHLHERQGLCDGTSSSEEAEPAPGSATVEVKGAGGDAEAVRAFLRECEAEKARRFSVPDVLSRAGTWSVSPVPPLVKAKGKNVSVAVSSIPAGPWRGEEGSRDAGMRSDHTCEGRAGEEGAADVSAFEPSAFPESFLSVAVAKVAAEGVDYTEVLAYNVFQVMKRLVSRQ